MAQSSFPGPVLITGCSTGVGHAAALAFRAAGFETFATARDPGPLDDLRRAGCHTLPLDVTDEAARKAAVDAVEARFGAVGVLVNNAGYGQYGPVEEVPLDAMRRQFETNVFGGLRLTQLVLPAMRRLRRGRIITVSSVAGRSSIPGGGLYHATKFSLEALADSLRPEVEEFGIDVVNVLPGPVDTHFGATSRKFIPDTGTASPYFHFKRNLMEFLRDFMKPGGFGVLTAEDVARVIVTAALAKRPRPRYPVGVIARLGPVGRAITPDRTVDWAMRRKIPNVPSPHR